MMLRIRRVSILEKENDILEEENETACGRSGDGGGVGIGARQE